MIWGDGLNIFVHLLIAHNVRKIAYKEIGAKLNLRGFLLGNILPDISKKYGEKPHYLKNSLEYVLRSTSKLNNPDKNNNINSFDYSRNIGVITHYLSDFFCFAHSEQYKDTIYKHHLYEFLMLFSLRRGLLLYKQKKKNEKPNDKFALDTYLKSNLISYNSEIKSSDLDICYAIKISVALTKNLLNIAMYKEKSNNFSDTNNKYCLGDDLNEGGIFL